MGLHPGLGLGRNHIEMYNNVYITLNKFTICEC